LGLASVGNRRTKGSYYQNDFIKQRSEYKMKKDKNVKVKFEAPQEDIRKISANVISHILDRFKNNYIESLELIGKAITYNTGKDVLESIESLFDGVDQISKEFEGIMPLLLEIKDEVEEPVAADLPSDT
jgi:TPP-dependent indolepyruvate ferredoxin oxidoreductase alpha subunit